MRPSPVAVLTALLCSCSGAIALGTTNNRPSCNRKSLSDAHRNKRDVRPEDILFGKGRWNLKRRNIIESITFVAGAVLPFPTAAYVDPKTGVLLPEEGEVEKAVPSIWDNENPFETMGRNEFSRLDSAPDSIFYTDPRFVEHVDENSVKGLTSYISNTLLQPGDSVLDLCSSWTSHIDANTQAKLGLKRVSGLGMNEKELSANSALTDWTVLDLNKNNPRLPYDDSSFDTVLCQLSIDYLTRPLEVMTEVGRVLKPGGKVAILFSNRLFLQKAVGLWTGADDLDHVYIVASYLHYSGGNFDQISAEDLSTRSGRGKTRRIVGDPLYAVTAVKKST